MDDHDIERLILSLKRYAREGDPNDSDVRNGFLDGILKDCDKKGSADFIYRLCYDYIGSLDFESEDEDIIDEVGDYIELYASFEQIIALRDDPMHVDAIFKLSALSLPPPGFDAEKYWMSSRDPWFAENGRPSLLAGCMAQEQKKPNLFNIIARYSKNDECSELIAALIQEMVIRNISVKGEPLIEEFWLNIKIKGHPLAILPLELTVIEDSIIPIEYNVDFLGTKGEEPEPEVIIEVKSHLGERIKFSEITNEYMSKQIASAVSGWIEYSNGESEARVFKTEEFAEEEIPNVLCSLGLEALKGVTFNKINCKIFSAHAVFIKLFCSSFFGGAYGKANLGAYGRLEAILSICALSGSEDLSNIMSSVSMAKKCKWVMFDAESDWYNAPMPMWKLGIMAIRPDQQTVAILAASDTD